MKRLHLVVSGIVQGVGFRWYTQRIAKSLGLTGWVRNLQNGNVEIVVEGKNDIIEMFISELKKGYLGRNISCLLYTSPSPRDRQKSRMPSSA